MSDAPAKTNFVGLEVKYKKSDISKNNELYQ